MPRFAANLSMLFNEVDFTDRFAAAAKAGFQGVEYLFPYAFEKERLADLLNENQLQQVLHNLPAGDWEAGERGIACLPDRKGEFQDGVGQAIEYAKALGSTQLNCLAGIAPAAARAEMGVDELARCLGGIEPQTRGQQTEKARQTLVDNLTFAANKLEAEGIKLLVEAINTYDIPGFYLCGTRQTLDIIEATGSRNIYLQYDIYHMQRMEGELAATMQKYLPQIAHIQLADNPGRNEPGSGEINYPFLFEHLDRIGYEGWIGCEYKPAKNTESGLGWASAFLK